MLKILKTIIFSIFCVTNSHASDFIALKVGSMSITNDITAFLSIDSDPINAGIVVGLDLGSTVSLEGELTSSVSGGEGDPTLAPGAKLEIQTVSIYGVMRTSGKYYLKGKAGLLLERITQTTPGLPSTTESDTGLSLGLGGGVKFNDNYSLEIENTIIEQDVDYLSVSFLTKF